MTPLYNAIQAYPGGHTPRGPSESLIWSLEKVEECRPHISIWQPWSFLPWSPCLHLNDTPLIMLIYLSIYLVSFFPPSFFFSFVFHLFSSFFSSSPSFFLSLFFFFCFPLVTRGPGPSKTHQDTPLPSYQFVDITGSKPTTPWIEWSPITSVCNTNENDMAFQQQILINIYWILVLVRVL